MKIKTVCILLMFVGIAVAVNNRMKKGMAGGIVDSELKTVPQDVVDSALAKFESTRERLEGSYGCTLTKPAVTQVKSQVVRGMMYYITVIAGLSPSPKENWPSDTCSEGLQKTFIECNIKVWSQPMVDSERHLSVEAQEISIEDDCQPSDFKMP